VTRHSDVTTRAERGLHPCRSGGTLRWRIRSSPQKCAESARAGPFHRSRGDSGEEAEISHPKITTRAERGFHLVAAASCRDGEFHSSHNRAQSTREPDHRPHRKAPKGIRRFAR
jgi:hypothetical protein